MKSILLFCCVVLLASSSEASEASIKRLKFFLDSERLGELIEKTENSGAFVFTGISNSVAPDLEQTFDGSACLDLQFLKSEDSQICNLSVRFSVVPDTDPTVLRKLTCNP